MKEWQGSLLKTLLCFFLMVMASTAVLARVTSLDLEDAFVTISENSGPAVVTINVTHMMQRNQPPSGHPFFDDFLNQFFYNMPRKQYRQQGLGTGFIINNEGFILTNEHVVGDADEIEVTLPDGRAFEARFVGSDPRSDIALIKIEGDNLPSTKIGDSGSVKPGQWAVALGHPFGNIVNNPKPTMTVGVISAIHRSIHMDESNRFYGDLIQTDASINQGNSGGPLVNLQGEVIAMNTLIFSPSGGNVGIGFAIPINRAKAIMDDLISGREIKHGWLGIWLQDATREIKEQFGMSPDDGGALIFKVEPDSPASEAGFLSGDVILSIDKEPVKNSGDVTRYISGKRPTDKIECLVHRGGKSIKVKAKIGERKDLEEQDSISTLKKETPQEWRGVTVTDITDEIVKELDLETDKGVVITRIKYNSSTSRTGLKRGDVIYSLGKAPVNSAKEFYQVGQDFLVGDVLIHSSRGYVILRETSEEEKEEEKEEESEG